MKKIILTLMAVLVTFLFSSAAFSGVEFLRGKQEISDPSMAPDKRKQEIVKGSFDRSYKIQPPMIPHKIDKDEINLKVNTCMKCHSAKTYKEKKAPKAGDSHYVTRDGKTLEKVSPRRYFCNQCYALQLNAAPLVDNTFVGSK
ncbi:nitrate reductase cytochrome c-type subunit [Solemya velesiana gill symbiont]|uniref:Periplasmic nitrate reductase, electron transfer subunit n=1 Tax=Solemya velesiana gill symbiont TaxID=1918948 RepID=A0A1T2KUF5_9GAMM|nr:nitrate reductase cytochrome c-type subunit [Solemya velesiana gill symbiont]OOZ36498.1 nitrate reductase [Solemya velesiana gill symbiont]